MRRNSAFLWYKELKLRSYSYHTSANSIDTAKEVYLFSLHLILGDSSTVTSNSECIGRYSFIHFIASAVCYNNPLKTGRYVGIMTTKQQLLQLCEVEIYSRGLLTDQGASMSQLLCNNIMIITLCNTYNEVSLCTYSGDQKRLEKMKRVQHLHWRPKQSTFPQTNRRYKLWVPTE